MINGLSYNPNGKINKTTYDSAFFEEYYNKFISEDIIRGTIQEGIHLEIGEIELYKETKADRSQETEKQKIFKGIFAKISLKNDFYIFKIKIRNNRVINFSPDKGKKIELESIDFENHFDFYAYDKIQALQIFTSETIEKMNYFREKYNMDFEMTLYRNEIYIRFPKRDFFEIKLGKNTLDYKMLKEYYEAIEMIGSIGIYFKELLDKKI